MQHQNIDEIKLTNNKGNLLIMNITKVEKVKQRFQLSDMLILALEQPLGEREKLNMEKVGIFNKISNFFNNLALETQPNVGLQPAKNILVC